MNQNNFKCTHNDRNIEEKNNKSSLRKKVNIRNEYYNYTILFNLCKFLVCLSFPLKVLTRLYILIALLISRLNS